MILRSIFLTLLACIPCLAGTPSPASRPNIILLLSDDQDWNGLSTQMHPDMPNSKSDFYETPNLDKFATQSMRFSNGYAPAPVCSPTRIAIQTGMNPARLGWTKAAPAETNHPLIEAPSRKAIRPDETTLAETLRAAGYSTAHFGKWHLSGGGPNANGYDTSDGDTSNRDADAFTDPNPVDLFGMTDRATAFMTENAKKNRPFYLQMSYYALHLPNNALKSSLARFNQKSPGAIHNDPARAAITFDLDTAVGKLLNAIDQLGISQNTYIVYLGDNGGGGGNGKKSTARPLRAGKGGVWEGGIRVPFIIRGPGIQANSWCHQPITGCDLFPTFCHLAGIDAKTLKNLDGGDFSPCLTNPSATVQRSRKELIFHFPHYQGSTPHSAIRSGDFKLIKFYQPQEIHLYNLSKDPGETNNLASTMPDLAKSLEATLTQTLKDYQAQMPTPNPTYDPSTEPTRKKDPDQKADKEHKKNQKPHRNANESAPTP